MIFEYINNSLENYISELRKKEQYIPINTIQKIAKQILLALKYCHKKNIVHRDFKPDNILISEDNIKICDFGSSKCITEGMTSNPYIVSRYYRTPELLLGKIDYNYKIDNFSAGYKRKN